MSNEDPSIDAIREVAASLWDHADVLQGLEAETLALLSAIGADLGNGDVEVPERHTRISAVHESFRTWATMLDEEAADLLAEREAGDER